MERNNVQFLPFLLLLLLLLNNIIILLNFKKKGIIYRNIEVRIKHYITLRII